RRSQNPLHAPRVAFMAGVLVHQLARLLEWESDRPRRGPCRGILGGEAVLDGVAVDAREALDEGEVLRCSAEFVLLRHIDRVADERAVLPAAARVAHPA